MYVDDHILPPNIAIRYFCLDCNTYLEYPACPKCNQKTAEPPPPLSVFVSDTAGVRSKVGK